MGATGILFWHAWVKSPTFDEIGHLQCGYYHWSHGDFERGLEHPPLVRLWAALPLRGMRLEDPEARHPELAGKPLSVKREQIYGTYLLYENRVPHEILLAVCRAMMVLLSLALLAGAAFWSRSLNGDSGGLLTALLFAGSPAFFGHGPLINTDVGGALGALLALFLFCRARRDPSWGNIALCGLGLGVAQATKLSNIFLIPLFAFFVLVYPGLEGKTGRRFTLNRPVQRLIALGIIIVLCILVLDASYGFQNCIPPHEIHPRDLQAYGWPGWAVRLYRILPLPDFYLTSLGFMLYHVQSGFPSYLMGTAHPEGVWYYFPLLFLFKTPIGALVLVGWAFLSLFKRKIRMEETVLLIAAGTYTALSMHSKLNLGIRHFFLIYPILFVLAGRIFAGPPLDLGHGLGRGAPPQPRSQVLAAWICVLAALLETGLAFPHSLAFSNGIAGGMKRSAWVSSDLDYGQDLKTLARFLDREPEAEVILSYCGTALPEAYGIHAQEVLPQGTLLHSERVNSDRPRQEYLAVSASHLQGMGTGGAFNWLKSRTPVASPGYSLCVYDVTRDLGAHEALAEIYRRSGDRACTERELRRIGILRAEPGR